MSKINLAEKLEFTSQIYRLLFGINNTRQPQKRLFSLVFKIEIEILIILSSL